MEYSQKVKVRAVQGLKKLIGEGHTRGAAVSAISELTGAPIGLLESWLAEQKASQQNNLSPPEKVDKLAPYRDKRMKSKRHPDDIKVEELQEKYLANVYDF